MTEETKPKPMHWIAARAKTVEAGQTVLDLACGSGRHGRAFLARGCNVTFVDIDTAGVADLADNPDCEILQADLEGGSWPLSG